VNDELSTVTVAPPNTCNEPFTDDDHCERVTARVTGPARASTTTDADGSLAPAVMRVNPRNTLSTMDSDVRTVKPGKGDSATSPTLLFSNVDPSILWAAPMPRMVTAATPVVSDVSTDVTEVPVTITSPEMP
jgi:hypothetical protein